MNKSQNSLSSNQLITQTKFQQNNQNYENFYENTQYQSTQILNNRYEERDRSNQQDQIKLIKLDKKHKIKQNEIEKIRNSQSSKISTEQFNKINYEEPKSKKLTKQKAIKIHIDNYGKKYEGQFYEKSQSIIKTKANNRDIDELYQEKKRDVITKIISPLPYKKDRIEKEIIPLKETNIFIDINQKFPPLYYSPQQKNQKKEQIFQSNQQVQSSFLSPVMKTFKLDIAKLSRNEVNQSVGFQNQIIQQVRSKDGQIEEKKQKMMDTTQFENQNFIQNLCSNIQLVYEPQDDQFNKSNEKFESFVVSVRNGAFPQRYKVQRKLQQSFRKFQRISPTQSCDTEEFLQDFASDTEQNESVNESKQIQKIGIKNTQIQLLKGQKINIGSYFKKQKMSITKDQGQVANIESEMSEENKEQLQNIQKQQQQQIIKNGLHKFQLNLSPHKMQYNANNQMNQIQKNSMNFIGPSLNEFISDTDQNSYEQQKSELIKSQSNYGGSQYNFSNEKNNIGLSQNPRKSTIHDYFRENSQKSLLLKQAQQQNESPNKKFSPLLNSNISKKFAQQQEQLKNNNNFGLNDHLNKVIRFNQQKKSQKFQMIPISQNQDEVQKTQSTFKINILDTPHQKKYHLKKYCSNKKEDDNINAILENELDSNIVTFEYKHRNMKIDISDMDKNKETLQIKSTLQQQQQLSPQRLMSSQKISLQNFEQQQNNILPQFPLQVSKTQKFDHNCIDNQDLQNNQQKSDFIIRRNSFITDNLGWGNILSVVQESKYNLIKLKQIQNYKNQKETNKNLAIKQIQDIKQKQSEQKEQQNSISKSLSPEINQDQLQQNQVQKQQKIRNNSDTQFSTLDKNTSFKHIKNVDMSNILTSQKVAFAVNPSIEQHEQKMKEMKTNFMLNNKSQKNKGAQQKQYNQLSNSKYQNLDLQILTSVSSGNKKRTFKLEGTNSFKTLDQKKDSKHTLREGQVLSEKNQPVNLMLGNNIDFLTSKKNAVYRNNKIEFSQHSLIRNKDLFTIKKFNEEMKNMKSDCLQYSFIRNFQPVNSSSLLQKFFNDFNHPHSQNYSPNENSFKEKCNVLKMLRKIKINDSDRANLLRESHHKLGIIENVDSFKIGVQNNQNKNEDQKLILPQINQLRNQQNSEILRTNNLLSPVSFNNSIKFSDILNKTNSLYRKSDSLKKKLLKNQMILRSTFQGTHLTEATKQIKNTATSVEKTSSNIQFDNIKIQDHNITKISSENKDESFLLQQNVLILKKQSPFQKVQKDSYQEYGNMKQILTIVDKDNSKQTDEKQSSQQQDSQQQNHFITTQYFNRVNSKYGIISPKREQIGGVGMKPDDEFFEMNEYLQSYHMEDDLLSSKILSDKQLAQKNQQNKEIIKKNNETTFTQLFNQSQLIKNQKNQQSSKSGEFDKYMVQVVFKKNEINNNKEIEKKSSKKKNIESQIIDDGINRFDDTKYITSNQILRGKFQKKKEEKKQIQKQIKKLKIQESSQQIEKDHIEDQFQAFLQMHNETIKLQSQRQNSPKPESTLQNQIITVLLDKQKQKISHNQSFASIYGQNQETPKIKPLKPRESDLDSRALIKQHQDEYLYELNFVKKVKKFDKLKLHKIDELESRQRKRIFTVLSKEELKDDKFLIDEMRGSSQREFYQVRDGLNRDSAIRSAFDNTDLRIGDFIGGSQKNDEDNSIMSSLLNQFRKKNKNFKDNQQRSSFKQKNYESKLNSNSKIVKDNRSQSPNQISNQYQMEFQNDFARTSTYYKKAVNI